MKNQVDSKLALYLPVFLPIIIVAIMGFLLFLPDTLTLIYQKTIYVPVLSELSFLEKFNTWLVVAIVVFACLESYSTYSQIALEQKRNIIKDARNELEKAYGILFAILNYRSETEEKFLNVHESDFKTIDKIMATYVWMFPKETNDLWNKTRRPTPIPTGLLGSLQEPIHSVSLEFRKKINEEYDLRVKKYYALLGKT
jgi:hypothetical protein